MPFLGDNAIAFDILYNAKTGGARKQLEVCGKCVIGCL